MPPALPTPPAAVTEALFSQFSMVPDSVMRPCGAAHARLAGNGSGDAYAGYSGIVRQHAAEDARQLALRHGDLRVGHGEVLRSGPVQNAEEPDGVVGALGRSDLQAAHGVARAVEGASERCAALGDAAALARAGADGRPLGALEIHVGAEGHVFAVIVVACVHSIAEGR